MGIESCAMVAGKGASFPIRSARDESYSVLFRAEVHSVSCRPVWVVPPVIGKQLSSHIRRKI